MNWFERVLRRLIDAINRLTGAVDNLPPTQPPGRNLLFGYFGTQPGDCAAIGTSANLTHIGAWGDWVTPQGRINLTNDIIGYAQASAAAGVPKVMYTLDWCIFTQTNPRTLLPEAQAVQYLTEFFNSLTSADVLRHAFAWYTIDEPNIPENNLSAVDVITANNLIYAVTDSLGIPRLPRMCIYGATNGAFPGIGSYEYAGFDNYGADIFNNGEYQNLVNQLTPSQYSILVPGGANPWRTDPMPWYQHAQTDLKVGLIMPFVYFDFQGPGTGIKSNGMWPQYQQVGDLVVAANS